MPRQPGRPKRCPPDMPECSADELVALCTDAGCAAVELRGLLLNGDQLLSIPYRLAPDGEDNPTGRGDVNGVIPQ